MKILLILRLIIGTISLIIGTIGVIVPLLPTTPFFLLAIGCFSSTPKIRNKLLKNKFINEYYNSYHNGQGLKAPTVIKSMILLWGALIVSIVLSQKLLVGLILIFIGIAVTIHIFYISKPREGKKDEDIQAGRSDF